VYLSVPAVYHLWSTAPKVKHLTDGDCSFSL